MFIENLTSKQQGILLGFVRKLIETDGEVSNSELDMIDVIKHQCRAGVTAEVIATDNLHELFADRREKVSFLMELLGVAYADAEYHIKEQQLIQSIAESLSVPSDELSQLEDWVKRQLALVSDAAKLMGA